MQLYRNSRRLGDVSACGASVIISPSESYWTLLDFGLLQPGNKSTSFSQWATCFYHVWIYLHLLARADEDAVLSDSAHSGGMAAAAVVPVALHRPWVRLDSEALVWWSSEILRDLFWWWAHERLKLVSSLGRVSPQLTRGPPFSNVGWALISTFSGFRVDPESISVSAASVKVVGVIRPVHNHTVSPLLAFFFSFHDPNALRTAVLLQPWKWWQAYAVPPYALLYTFLLKAPLILWGPQCTWFSGASESGSRRFGGSASDQGSVEPALGAVTTSGSVRASSPYLVTIQQFLSSRVFSRRVASQAPMVGWHSSRAGY